MFRSATEVDGYGGFDKSCRESRLREVMGEGFLRRGVGRVVGRGTLGGVAIEEARITNFCFETARLCI